MEKMLKAMYIREIDCCRLDFDHDPEYQKYYTQAQELWKGADMPDSIYHLLDTSNYLSFLHGFLLGMESAKWCNSLMDKRLEHFR